MEVLDPLVLGVIPESLVPVIGYACVVALLAWFVVSKIAVKLIRMAATSNTFKKNGNIRKLE
jgi:hypothetical protein